MEITSKTLQKSYIWRSLVLIFVTVGSRQYPFNRLFKQLDKLYEQNILKEEMFAQIGTSSYKPQYFNYQKFISPVEFQQKITSSDVIITHGASGTIMQALKANKKIVVVTRLEKYGEHINDHQIQNNKAFSKNQYVLMADLELDNLGECINSLIEDSVVLKPWENQEPDSIIKMIDNFIQENWTNE